MLPSRARRERLRGLGLERWRACGAGRRGERSAGRSPSLTAARCRRRAGWGASSARCVDLGDRRGDPRPGEVRRALRALAPHLGPARRDRATATAAPPPARAAVRAARAARRGRASPPGGSRRCRRRPPACRRRTPRSAPCRSSRRRAKVRRARRRACSRPHSSALSDAAEELDVLRAAVEVGDERLDGLGRGADQLEAGRARARAGRRRPTAARAGPCARRRGRRTGFGTRPPAGFGPRGRGTSASTPFGITS